MDFTRDRKLTFTKVVLFIINLSKKSLAIELTKFLSLFDSMGEGMKCSKSAFSQARKKLDPEFFSDWNDLLVNEFYTDNDLRVKRWNGFRIFGVDGSTARLIDKPDIIEYFGCQPNGSIEVPMARLMSCYDVLNNMGFLNKIMPYQTSEQSIALEWIDKYEDDMLCIYDRNFTGFAFYYQNQIKQQQFVVRGKVSFTKEVKAFVESGQKSTLIELKATQNAIEKHAIDKNAKVTVRFVRVELDTGEVEVLITSLLDEDKYLSEMFKDLYILRWGVETYFDRLKNKMQIEIFSGYSVEAIKQDFYAMIFISNLQSLIIDECEEDVKKINQNRKYEYQINWNVSLGLMKDEIVKIFSSSTPETILEKLKSQFLDHLEPVRPGRKYSRHKKRKLNGKYHTLTNYRRAI